MHGWGPERMPDIPLACKLKTGMPWDTKAGGRLGVAICYLSTLIKSIEVV